MPDQLTIEAWLRVAAKHIGNAGSSTPDFDAKLLLMDVAGFSAVDLISRGNEPLELKMKTMADVLVQRRVNGEPVHRILGWREFYGRKFHLSDETLIPRPDTEILIDIVLRNIDKNVIAPRMLDIGTGSGAIAVTLAAELPGSQIVATDISQDALATAMRNAEALDVADAIEFIHSDLFGTIEGCFDFIVSNPPYIPDSDINSLQREVRLHDPYAALAGGGDGLDFYRRIFAGAKACLKAEGMVCVEIGEGQSDDIIAIMRENGFELADRACDLSGIERVICGRC